MPVERALSTTLHISLGDRNCPFFEFTGLPQRATAQDEIRLPAQERGRLEHVDDGRDLVERRVLVHVGEHRHADLGAHALEHPEAPLDPEAAKPAQRRAVRLVERRLEHERHAELRGDRLELLGNVEHERLALDHAGPGDQEQWSVLTDVEARQASCAAWLAGTSIPGKRAPR